jgi:xylulokinase
MAELALLGLDVGTSSCKAMVLAGSGRELARGRVEYQLSYLDCGWVELDLTVVWAAVTSLIRQVTAQARANGGAVGAISLAVSGDEAVPVGADGGQLRPCIMAMDSRTADLAERFGQQVGSRRIYEITGLPVHAMHPLVRLMWIREHEPEVFAGTAKMLCWSELITSLLGAAAVSDYSVASRTMAFDIVRQEWSQEMLTAAGIAPSLMPGLAPSGTVIGEVPGRVADELGIQVGTAIVTGGFDQPMAALGSGVVDRGDVGVGTGSWEALVAVTDAPVLTDRMLEAGYPFGCYVLPGRFFCLASSAGGGSLLRWYKDTFGADDVRRARRGHADPFDVILQDLPDEPTGMIVLPHFQGSYSPWMDPGATGAILGMSLATTRGEFVKAILEGTAFELRANIERIERAGLPITGLRATGGGARSSRWLQLKADVTGKPISTVNVDEAGCFAAACMAGVGAGLFASAADPIRAWVRPARVFEPNPARKDVYDAIFADYLELVRAVAPFSHAITSRRSGKR